MIRDWVIRNWKNLANGFNYEAIAQIVRNFCVNSFQYDFQNAFRFNKTLIIKLTKLYPSFYRSRHNAFMERIVFLYVDVG